MRNFSHEYECVTYSEGVHRIIEESLRLIVIPVTRNEWYAGARGVIGEFCALLSGALPSELD